MKRVLQFTLALIMGTVWSFAACGELPTGDTTGSKHEFSFRFVFPSDKEHIEPDWLGPQNYEERNVPLEEIPQVLEHYRDRNLLATFDQKPPILYVYLPSRRVLEDSKQRLATQFAKDFEHVLGYSPEVRFRATSGPVFNLKQFIKNLRTIGKAEEINFPKDAVAQSIGSTLSEVATKAESLVNDTVLEAGGIKAFHAQLAKYSVATGRFALIFGMRLAKTYAGTQLGIVPFLAGWTITITDPILEALSVILQEQIQRKFSTGPIPILNKRLSVEATQFLNKMTWNTFSNGFARPLVNQWLIHFNDSNVRAPTAGDVGGLLLIGLAGSVVFTGFDHGVNLLRQKGWLSGAQIEVIRQVSGVFDVLTNIFSSIPSTHWLRVFTLTPQWLGFVTLYALGRVAPIRVDRILAVDARIDNWSEIKEEQIAHRSMWIENQTDFDAAVAFAQKSRPLRITNVGCADILARLKSATAAFFRR